MPIFKKKTEEKKDKDEALKNSPDSVKEERKKVKTHTASGTKSYAKDAYGRFLLNPRITEKATLLSERNAYVFDVDIRANKRDISLAIKEVYGVKPVGVNTISVKQKRVFIRGKNGTRSRGKKAIVYLKEGDKIEIV